MKQWQFWFLIGTLKELIGYVADSTLLIAVGIFLQITSLTINLMGWDFGAEGDGG
jgi:hypothetical protein